MHVSKGQKIQSTGKEKIEAHTLKIRVCFSFMTLNGRFVISFLFFFIFCLYYLSQKTIPFSQQMTLRSCGN